MNNTTGFRACFIDTGMEVEFQRRLAVALDHIAVKINDAEIINRQRAARAIADIDQNLVAGRRILAWPL